MDGPNDIHVKKTSWLFHPRNKAHFTSTWPSWGPDPPTRRSSELGATLYTRLRVWHRTVEAAMTMRSNCMVWYSILYSFQSILCGVEHLLWRRDQVLLRIEVFDVLEVSRILHAFIHRWQPASMLWQNLNIWKLEFDYESSLIKRVPHYMKLTPPI